MAHPQPVSGFPAEESLEEEEEEGTESMDFDLATAIEGRTSSDDFQPFFDEKTFGLGESGALVGPGLVSWGGCVGGWAQP